jgi:hypothetical protein
VARGVTKDDLKDKNATFINFKNSAEAYATMDKVFVF